MLARRRRGDLHRRATSLVVCPSPPRPVTSASSANARVRPTSAASASRPTGSGADEVDGSAPSRSTG